MSSEPSEPTSEADWDGSGRGYQNGPSSVRQEYPSDPAGGGFDPFAGIGGSVQVKSAPNPGAASTTSLIRSAIISSRGRATRPEKGHSRVRNSQANSGSLCQQFPALETVEIGRGQKKQEMHSSRWEAYSSQARENRLRNHPQTHRLGTSIARPCWRRLNPPTSPGRPLRRAP